MQEEVIFEKNVCEEVIENENEINQERFVKTTQTINKPMYDYETFANDDTGIHFYTELETYSKFKQTFLK